MFGHEDVRNAIRDHLVTAMPAHLAGVRSRRAVTSPVDPVAYLLADVLTAATQYPAVLIRSPGMAGTQDAGDGTWISRYSIEVAVAAEVVTAGAYAAASVARDRLAEALRAALLTPSATLSPAVTVASKTLAESHGPAAETLAGRPLAVGVCSFTAVVVETLPPLPSSVESIGAHDLTVTASSAGQEI